MRNVHILRSVPVRTSWACQPIVQYVHRSQMLAPSFCRPAWRLAATLAQDARCADSTREGLLAFALAAAPADQLLPLLLQWQAADTAHSAGGSGCWALFSAADTAADSPDCWAEQQRWLARQLRLHVIALGRSSSGACSGAAIADEAEAGGAAGAVNEAAALGCLLALGPRGLLAWERLLSEQLPRPLGARQRRRALLLGVTASALLALQPSDVDPAGVAAAAAAAQARLEASPAALLQAVQEQQQAAGSKAVAGQQQPAGSEGSSTPPLSGAASDSGEQGSSSDAPAAPGGKARAAAIAAASAAAVSGAAMAAERFFGLLLAAADAQQLQRLLPGIDAAAALAGGPGSRRQLALQLAAAAGKPPAGRAGGGAAGLSVGRSHSQAALSPHQQQEGGSAASSPGGREVQRALSRKKVEALPAGQAEGAAAPGSPRLPFRHAGAGEPGEMLQQALALAAKSGVAAWEVHLTFVMAVLSNNQQPTGAAQLLEASLAQLVGGPPQAAAGLLHGLLQHVWPRCSSRWPQHLDRCLQAMQQCGEALAASAGGKGGDAGMWRAVAAVCLEVQAAADRLVQAAGGIDAKLFVEPLVQLVATAASPALDASSSSCCEQPVAAPVDAAVLNQQLLAHVTGNNVGQMAAAVDDLRQQHAAAVASLSAVTGATSAAYPCSCSTVHLALFCRTVATGKPTLWRCLPTSLPAWQAHSYTA